MKTWCVAAALAAVLSVSWTMPVHGQGVGLYDDFSSGDIDPARWLGYHYSIGGSGGRDENFWGRNDAPGAYEFIDEAHTRGVVDGRAQITLTSYLPDSWASYPRGYLGPRGRSGFRVNHAALADGNPRVTTFRATVTVAAVSVPDDPPDYDCRPSTSGRAGAQIAGHFLNDGIDANPNALTGDVFAVLALDRRVMRSQSGSAGVQNVMEVSIGRCRNPDCSRFDPVGEPQVLPRRWRTGVPYVLTITWRPASQTFAFTVAGGGFSDTQNVDYVTTESRPPRGYAYDVRVETRPVICRVPGVIVNRRVSIDARFDNVYLNLRAADAAP